METIKGYKVFNPDWTCNGFQYKVGETYIHDGEIELYKSGFHFCQKAADCFNYYKFDSENKVAEVEAIGTVKTQFDQSVTDKIKIVRIIDWQELLTIVINESNKSKGMNNTGNFNIGNKNTGNWNIGNMNTGDNNKGHRNTGNYNTGDQNTGEYNSGDCNTGHYNSGHCNTHSYNSGDCNTGDYNSGDYNTGIMNSGNRNTGNFNIGNGNVGSNNSGHYNIGNNNAGCCNTGNYNNGDRNTGSWNSASFCTGFFNSEQHQVYMFNKPINMSLEDINNLEGIKVLERNFFLLQHINAEDMTEEEKKNHPEYKTFGKYIKASAS